MISPSGRTRHRKPMPHWLMMHPRAVARQLTESLRDFMSINQAHSGPRFSRQDDGARTSGGHFAGSDYHVPVLAEEVIAAVAEAPRGPATRRGRSRGRIESSAPRPAPLGPSAPQPSADPPRVVPVVDTPVVKKIDDDVKRLPTR